MGNEANSENNKTKADYNQVGHRPELQRLTSWDLNREYYEELFTKIDTDANGEVSRDELSKVLKEYKAPRRIINQLFAEGDTNHDGRLQREEFIELVQRNAQIFKPWEKMMMNCISRCVPYKPPPEEDHSAYYNAIRFCPPPLWMLCITLFQITIFYLNTTTAKSQLGPMMGRVAQALMFDPSRRVQLWRYLTYALVHASPLHLTINMLVQILSGITLELVHRERILAIYFAGVLGGSLWTSILEASNPLVGASAGVYALITALIVNIILNWREMGNPLPPFTALIIFVVCDISNGLYETYYLERVNSSISVTAHVSGAILGALTGLIVLKNLCVVKVETKMQHWALMIILASSIYAISYNIYQMTV